MTIISVLIKCSNSGEVYIVKLKRIKLEIIKAECP